jgi:hypothetical protein
MFVPGHVLTWHVALCWRQLEQHADVVALQEERTPLPLMTTTSWGIGTFDPAGEVQCAGMRTLTHPVVRLALHVNRVYG